jgi:hypothetical protein
MNRKYLLYFLIFALLAGSGIQNSPVFGKAFYLIEIQKDPLRENQILYNGKVWHNLYTNIKGDQFLFSKSYLPGSLTINGKTYNNLRINFDIYNDELTTPKNDGTILQLNKEMVDSFTLVYEFKTYSFRNTQADSLPAIKGFVNVLYKGKSALYVKYKKELEMLAVDDKYDLFFQTHKIYLVRDSTVFQVSSKSDLLKAFPEEKNLLKVFMKKNRVKISRKMPESFIPVIRYYDSISK